MRSPPPVTAAAFLAAIDNAQRFLTRISSKPTSGELAYTYPRTGARMAIRKLSRTPGQIDSAGPTTPGEHNEEIYCGRLGLTKDDLAALGRKGIV